MKTKPCGFLAHSVRQTGRFTIPCEMLMSVWCLSLWSCPLRYLHVFKAGALKMCESECISICRIEIEFTVNSANNCTWYFN